MRILLYLAIIIAGGFLGYWDKLPKGLTSKLSRLQFFSLLFLLFIMGLNIGLNKEVVNTFFKLGYQAVVLSIMSIIFSIAGVRIVAGIITKNKEDSENEC